MVIIVISIRTRISKKKKKKNYLCKQISATKIFLSLQISNDEKIKTDKVENQHKTHLINLWNVLNVL